MSSSASTLARIAAEHGFDGYLINIENPLNKDGGGSGDQERGSATLYLSGRALKYNIIRVQGLPIAGIFNNHVLVVLKEIYCIALVP